MKEITDLDQYLPNLETVESCRVIVELCEAGLKFLYRYNERDSGVYYRTDLGDISQDAYRSALQTVMADEPRKSSQSAAPEPKPEAKPKSQGKHPKHREEDILAAIKAVKASGTPYTAKAVDEKYMSTTGKPSAFTNARFKRLVAENRG